MTHVASLNPATVARVRSQGTVDAIFNVSLKDFHRYGYRNGSEVSSAAAAAAAS